MTLKSPTTGARPEARRTEHGGCRQRARALVRTPGGQIESDFARRGSSRRSSAAATAEAQKRTVIGTVNRTEFSTWNSSARGTAASRADCRGACCRPSTTTIPDSPGAWICRDSLRDDPRGPHYSGGRTAPPVQRHAPVDGGLTRPLGRRDARGGSDELHGQDADPPDARHCLEGRAQSGSAGHRAFRARGRRYDRLPIHGRRSQDVCAHLDSRHPDDETGSAGPDFQDACHEGNYAVPNISVAPGPTGRRRALKGRRNGFTQPASRIPEFVLRTVTPTSAAALVVVFLILHQDFWFWREARPSSSVPAIGLFYHAMYTVACALLLGLLVRRAWPAHLDR